MLGPHDISSESSGSTLGSSGLKCLCGERANAMVTEGWRYSKWLIAELTTCRVIKAQRSGAAISVWQTRSSFCLIQLRIQAFSLSWLLDDRRCLIYERLPEIQHRRRPKRLSENWENRIAQSSHKTERSGIKRWLQHFFSRWPIRSLLIGNNLGNFRKKIKYGL